MIHIKDYMEDLSSKTPSDSTQYGIPEDNIVKFPEREYVSKEYIGKFVDQLMSMPEDQHRDISINKENSLDPFDVVASRILSEEKW